MKYCKKCDVEFGVKFKENICAGCEHSFCCGHFLKEEYLILDKGLEKFAKGICFECLFTFWRIANDVQAPRGMWGRFKLAVSNSVNNAVKIMMDERTNHLKIHSKAFDKILNDKTHMFLFHQRDLTDDFIMKDMQEFARIYAVSIGRNNERELCLNDFYRVVEWIKSHPLLPNFIHGFSWSKIEKSRIGIDILMDAWHLAGGISSLSTGNIVWAAYHWGDRLVDQKTGHGLASTIVSKLGLNINALNAVRGYFIGKIILKLYEMPEV